MPEFEVTDETLLCPALNLSESALKITISLYIFFLVSLLFGLLSCVKQSGSDVSRSSTPTQLVLFLLRIFMEGGKVLEMLCS